MGKNIAVIGCGYWGKNLVRNYAELGTLNIVCDSSEDALSQIKSKYPEVDAETDFDRVLGNDHIDGIVIASPATMHYPMARQALLARKDVFVEKPLALTVEQGKELVELAGKSGRVLMVGHLLEYHPAVAALKELLDNGDLGNVQYVYSNRLNLGKFRTEENILWSFAPHDISVIMLLLGGEIPQRVSAHGGNYLNQDIADVTLSTLDFRGGVKAHIFVSWLHPFKEHRLVVVGDQGMAEFNDGNPKDKLFLYRHEVDWIEGEPVPQRKDREVIPVPLEEPLKLECQEFLNCVEARSKPKVDGLKGVQVLKVLAACQESLWKNGETTPLSED